jgi:hypothetical protein
MHLFFEKAELPICNSKAKNNNWALVQLSKEGVDLYNGSTFHHIEVVRENECCKKCLKKAIKLQENADRIALEIFKNSSSVGRHHSGPLGTSTRLKGK